MTINVKKAIKLIIADKNGLSNLRKQTHPLMIQINERISSLIRDNILININGSFNDVYIHREALPDGEKLTTSNFMKEFMSDIFSPYEKSKVTTQLRMFTAGQLRKYKGYKKRNKGKLPNFIAVRSDNLVMGDGFFEFYKNKITTPTGFEPARAEPNRFLVDLLNHSDTVSMMLYPGIEPGSPRPQRRVITTIPIQPF